jgi:hypothetical protein
MVANLTTNCGMSAYGNVGTTLPVPGCQPVGNSCGLDGMNGFCDPKSVLAGITEGVTDLTDPGMFSESSGSLLNYAYTQINQMNADAAAFQKNINSLGSSNGLPGGDGFLPAGDEGASSNASANQDASTAAGNGSSNKQDDVAWLQANDSGNPDLQKLSDDTNTLEDAQRYVANPYNGLHSNDKQSVVNAKNAIEKDRQQISQDRKDEEAALNGDPTDINTPDVSNESPQQRFNDWMQAHPDDDPGKAAQMVGYDISQDPTYGSNGLNMGVYGI